MSIKREPTIEQFNHDIRDHKLTVLFDQGVYRHLRLCRPGTSCYLFDIITAPGILIYTGDMGGFTFRRLADMFEFFRGDHGSINPSYWSEKVEAADKGSGIKEFSEDKFNAAVKEHLVGWIKRNASRTNRKERRELWDAGREEVIGADGDPGAYRKQCAANDFSHRVNSQLNFYFQDFWETTVDEYTFRFIWCCRAIVWAINQYDARKAETAAAAVEIPQ